MYTEVHLVSDKSDNTGSCFKYAKYLTKENDFFFSSTEDKISLEDAYKMIDEHSKGQLGADEAKWYAPVYSLSEKESKALVKKLFDKDLDNYDDLTDEEKIIFKEELVKYARSFQDIMAENFNKKEIGISSGKDLMYIGVVECSRTYKGYDIEVINGIRKQGEKKKGFNAHIQLIQSRKANNEKKSKISPMSKAKSVKSNFGGKGGFDRNIFKEKIEKKIDELLQYKREVKESFLYQKNKKLGDKLDSPYSMGKKKRMGVLTKEILQKIDANHNDSSIKKEYISKKEINFLSEKVSLFEYFLSLEKKGILKYKYKKNDEYIFEEVGIGNKSEIVVSGNKWNDPGQYIGGNIIRAIQMYENKTWIEAVKELRVISNKNIDSTKIGYLKSVQVSKFGDIKRRYLYDYFLKEGISEKVIAENIKEITYKNPKTGKDVVTTGIRNINGGFHVKNKYVETDIGNDSISKIDGNKNVVIFGNMMEYLKYLELHDITKLKETVVILHKISNKTQLLDLLDNEKYYSIYTAIDNTSLHEDLLKYDKNLKLINRNKIEDAFQIEKLKEMIKKIKI
jgi:mobilization protein B